VASPLGRVQISLRLRQSIVDAYVLDILEGRSAHERATMSLRRKQPKQTNVSRCPEALLKRRKNRGGESNFYPAVRAPTRRQKEKGCQQFFAKTACVFLFQPEGTEPLHVHVEQAERYAKFWLEPVVASQNSRVRMSVAIRQGQARAGIPFGVSHVMVIYPKTRYMRPVVRPFV